MAVFNHLNRFQAFIIHLVASIIVFSCLLVIMFFVWYASPFFKADGGLNILGVVGGVDVILGPALTFIVFKAGKASLKFDLSVIVAIQLAALFFGASLIFKERPGYAVFVRDQFVIVSASQVDPKKYPDQKVGVFSKPKYMVSMFEYDPELKKKYKDKFLFGHDFEVASTAPELYRPYGEAFQYAVAAGRPLTDLTQYSEPYAQKVNAFLESNALADSEVVYLQLTGKRKLMALVLRKSDGHIMGAIDLNPELVAIGSKKNSGTEALKAG